MALLHYYDNPPIEHDLDKAIELFLEAEGGIKKIEKNENRR